MHSPIELFPQEFTHSRKCHARAMICAIENIRDQEGLDRVGYRLEIQRNIMHVADGYLADGLCDCQCAVGGFQAVKDRISENEDGSLYLDDAASLGEALCKNGQITPGEYITLARWFHGKIK